jgi:predicted transposase YbfD/YdcC
MSGRTEEYGASRGNGYPAAEAWREPCRDKKQKKRVLQGEEVHGAKRKSTRPGKKQRQMRNPAKHSVVSMIDCFDEITDPRINRRRRHLLIDIIVIATLAMIANANTWKAMQIWAEANEAWLRKFLELPNGIPSRDTLRRTISRLDPNEFQQAFLRWLEGLKKHLGGVVAIDGKTLRRSGQGDDNPLHIVSAWATDQHLTLGQQVVDDKSNEITAIPELLKLLELKGAIVTIDAMGCQKEIARQIVEAGGDYCLAVKGNQETLAEDVQAAFEASHESEFSETSHEESHTTDQGHGRVEQRYYVTMPAPDSLRTAEQWKGLQSIGMTVTYRSEESEGEVRYYINSFACDGERFAHAVRNHWGIENSLHWVMDVTFREDESRIRKDYGGENVSWLRRLAISIIKNDKTRKDSIQAKRIRAGYDVTYLEQILNSLVTEN